MALEDINRANIALAIEEFEQIGRVAMLEKYRGGRARNWYVDGEYDLKLTCRVLTNIKGWDRYHLDGKRSEPTMPASTCVHLDSQWTT